MKLRRATVRILQSLVGLTLLLLVVAGGVVLWLRGSLPVTNGHFTIAGLEAPVDVVRDANGIVTIRAESESDAYIALGFVHAQDRLWQMDFMRRTGAGRLSEIVGDGTLTIDRLARTLGLYRAAQANLEHLSPPVRATLDAYTAGVNAYIEGHDGPWPPEFYLLRYKPEPWRPTDSLVWGRLMALQLSGNWSDEVRRLRLAKRLTPEQVDFLWPSYPPEGPISLDEWITSYLGPPPVRPGDALPWDWAPKSASNSWVVSGNLTTSGKPILANDPHLALNAPGVWYLARLETPGLTLAGATAPGVPFLVVGHNEHIAWGFTTTEGDTQDIFIERLSEGAPSSYDTPDGPRRFETRTETIELRDDEPVTLEVRSTRHGPVVSDVFSEAAALAGPEQVLAIAWPALLPDDRSAEALYNVNRARNWDQFVAALRDWHSPQQTITFADTSGTIGLIAPARVPIRKSGDGRLPVPGWTGEYDWEGFIPFDELPMRKNPADGRFVTANNRLVGDDYPHLITATWRNPYRADRILELLDESPRTSVGDHEALQQDILSPGARALVPLLLETAEPTDDTQYARELLEAWDYEMDRNRPEPLIFYAWLYQLNRFLLADKLGATFPDFQRSNAELMTRLLRDGVDWCNDVTTDLEEDCSGQVARALEAALTMLRQAYGSDPDAWRWGDVHVTRFPHPVLNNIPVIGDIFAYPIEADGGSYTVNRAGVLLSGPASRLFENVHGPGYRAVYDLSDLDKSRFMIATGQSGNPFSKYYGSLARLWRDGDYVELTGRPAEGDKLLLLSPR